MVTQEHRQECLCHWRKPESHSLKTTVECPSENICALKAEGCGTRQEGSTQERFLASKTALGMTFLRVGKL